MSSIMEEQLRYLHAAIQRENWNQVRALAEELANGAKRRAQLLARLAAVA
jgi:hypothetical protein